SFNIQHWRFVLIRDEELRREVRKVAWNQAQVTDASLLVLICGDAKAWSKQPERYWVNVPQAVREFLVGAISNVYQDSPEWQRDEVMRSAGIAAQTLMLMARSMGYDSCPMVGFDFEEVARLVRLPDDHLIAMMVAIGRPLQPAQERGGQLPYQEVVLENRFP
ncbi:MAG: nitroreductase family protein, partial [Planctomycetota bacterium]